MASFAELLDFAIKQEEEAAAFYAEWSRKATEPSVRETLLELAEQERGHKARLESIKAGGKIAKAGAKVRDLQISDYLVDVEAKANMSFQEALIFAMKKEKAAFRMYSDMAASATSDEAKKVLRFLAQEEAAHKLGFEIEYDDLVYQEN